MSKKIAGGADYIVLDVKVGNGALMKNEQDARLLADYILKIGKHYNKKVVCLLTNMNEPLGNSVGNGLEVLESIDLLKNKGPKDLKEIVLALASQMVHYGLDISLDEAYIKCQESLENQKALQKFEELVKWQGGDISKIAVSDKVVSLKSPKTGFITDIDTLKIGLLAKELGAGRMKENEKIDYGVGLVLNKKVGDYVTEGEELVKIYMNEKDLPLQEVVSCFTIDTDKIDKRNLIIDILSN